MTMRNVQFYIGKHLGCTDPECDGNKVILNLEEMERLRDKFIDWNEHEDGSITSLGTDEWVADNKTFMAMPVIEDDDALSITERLFFDVRPLMPYLFRATINPNWDDVPEDVRANPVALAQLEKMREQTYKPDDIARFLCDNMVTNVKFDKEALAISGYDHLSTSEYIFSPVVN
jgi:hypothetical protein